MLGDALNDLIGKLMRLENRPHDVAVNEDIVLGHPLTKHGIFLREDGAVDISSAKSLLSISEEGFLGVAPAMVLNVSDALMNVGTHMVNGRLVFNGYEPDKEIWSGAWVCRFLKDASVLILPGTQVEVQRARGEYSGSRSPHRTLYSTELGALEAVPLSDLIEPVREFRQRQRLVERAIARLESVMQRVGIQ